MASQTALNTSSTSTSSGVPAATHAAIAFLDQEQMLLRSQAQIDQCVHMLKTKKEMIERCEKQALVTDACCESSLMSLMPLSCMSVNTCKLPRNSWPLSCGKCKRSENVLLMIAWTRRCLFLLLPRERRKAGTKHELRTVYELANRRPGAVYKYRAQGQVLRRAHTPDLCR